MKETVKGIRLCFARRLAEKEAMDGQRYGVAYLMREFGVQAKTVYRWKRDKVSHLHLDTLAAWCAWFGVPVSGLGYFFEEVKDDEARAVA